MTLAIDNAAFTKLWNNGATCVEISKIFGLTERQVWNRRKMLGLEPRSARAGVKSRHSYDRRAQEPASPVTAHAQERQLDVSAIHPTPGWDVPILAQLFRCKGYADLAAFAAMYGKSITSVQQKWHQVRAAK